MGLTARLANALEAISAAASCWHGPLVECLSEKTNCGDSTISNDLQQGFSCIIELTIYDSSAKPKVGESFRPSHEHAWALRSQNNFE